MQTREQEMMSSPRWKGDDIAQVSGRVRAIRIYPEAQACKNHPSKKGERHHKDGEPDLAHQKACGGDMFGKYDGKAQKDYDGAKVQNASDVKRRILAGMRERKTLGWDPTCDCHEKADGCVAVPCSVLDPFHGTGTTGQACIELGRHYTGIDLSEDYIKASDAKDSQTALGLV